MHVSEFLYPFGLGEDVEIVATPLPELIPVPFASFRGLALEDAKGGIEASSFGLGDEKVNVLGREDVVVDVEVVLLMQA